MKHITSKWPHQDSIKIEWNLGKRCNLDCGYCPAEIHDNFSPHTDIDILKQTVDTLAALDKPVRISLTGGEPCVHPRIDHLLYYASKRVDWINVTTNASRKAQWYAQQPVNHYVFSLHFDNKSVNQFVKTITEFSTISAIPFHVNVMAHHEHMTDVRDAVELFELYHISYAIRRIRWTEKHDWFDDMKYDAQDLEWLMDHDATAKANCLIDGEQEMHANDVIKKHLNQFKDWKCNAGLESLMINWDGEVHRATCRVGGSLGNIYKGTFEQPKEAVICTRQWCTCAADIPLTKTQS